MNDEEYLKKLVIARLKTIPPNICFSIGGFGDFSRDQLISEVSNSTSIGKATVNRELRLLREMPNLSKMLAEN